MDRAWTKESKLIIGIDVGTTCSAVSYIHVTKGAIPEIQRVIGWPGQILSEERCKTPSWICYDADNKPIKFGAEAVNQDPEEAEKQGYFLARYFKLHLHPTDLAPPEGFKVDPLPLGLSVGRVYADYFRYLFQHTRDFFRDHAFQGHNAWQLLYPTMDVGTLEQGVLRTAAVQAGWSTSQWSQRQISFVSEAEASVQFCLDSSQTASLLSPKMNLIVCDAGGSTVDTTAYKIIATEPMLELEEVKSSACIQAGSIYVDDVFENYLVWKLREADLDDDDIDLYSKDALENFVDFIKPGFSGAEKTLDLKIGYRKLKIPEIEVQSGRMKVPKPIVKTSFDSCVNRIIPSVLAQAQGVESPHFFLVGGFGDNPYLKTSMRERLRISDRLTTSNKPGVKPVADGAAIWAIARSVVSRVTRYSFGTDYCVPYNEHDPAQNGRAKRLLPSGMCIVADGWSEIVAEETLMSYDSSLQHSYTQQFRALPPTRNTIVANIYSTTSNSDAPFMRDRHGVLLPGWKHVCVVSAEVENPKGTVRRHKNPTTGMCYWTLSFRIAIRFGGTQLEAFIEWEENGTTMTGPATVIPAPFI
ncbi:hypothetical protein FRC09_018716 [Ceratobasidium sp. 395]|nr:hypothetical protein FRC09_018716 [Ceratobasidium sp. 395]